MGYIEIRTVVIFLIACRPGITDDELVQSIYGPDFQDRGDVGTQIFRICTGLEQFGLIKRTVSVTRKRRSFPKAIKLRDDSRRTGWVNAVLVE